MVVQITAARLIRRAMTPARRGWLNRLGVVALLGNSLVMFLLMWPLLPACKVYAQQPTGDFCYSLQVGVTNSTGSTLTDAAVSFTVNAAEFDTSNYMKPAGNDVMALDSAGSDVPLFTQDLTSTTARWWLQVDSLASGATETFTIFMGAQQAWRNNGIFLNGASGIRREHHTDFNITDNLRIDLIVETATTHGSVGWLLSHWRPSRGYRVGTIDISGTKYIRAQVDNETLDVAWNGTLETVRVEYQDPTLTIDFYDDATEAFEQQGTLTTSSGAIGTHNEALEVGYDSNTGGYYTGVIRLVDLIDSINTTPSLILRWGMHGPDVTESTAVDPTYMGTIQDDGANNYDGTYTIMASQTNITANHGSVVNNFTDAALTVQTRLFADIMGTVADVDLTTASGASTSIPLVGRVQAFATDFGIGNEVIWMLTFTIISIMGAVTMLTILQSTPAALAVPGFLLTIGSVLGMLSPWVPMVYGLVAVGCYGFVRIGRSA